MTTRVLPMEDWPILNGTELGAVLPLLEPCASDVRVMAVFDADGCLSGCWAALKMAHVEGVWVDDAHRGKAGVQRALLRGMRDALVAWGVTSAITGAADSAIQSLLSKNGRAVKLPDCYVLRMES